MVNYIESKDNPKIKNALKIAADASARRKNRLFFAATGKVVMDILAAGFKAQAVFCLEAEYDDIFAESEEEAFNIASDERIYAHE